MLITGVGRLGRDAELRYIPSGTAVANLALAFNYGQKQQDGSRLSQWVDCALWGKQAETLVQYLKRGNQVSITASDPHIEQFTRGDGTVGSKMVANIVHIELIGGQNNEANAGTAQPTQQRPQSQQPAAQNKQDNFDADYYDDIQF